MKHKERKKEPAEETVATWDESIHINRGQEAESDEIQKIVRHHRKDKEHDLHEEHEVKQDEQGKKPAEPGQAA